MTERDVRHLERHLSMKKTIRKKMMRDLRQAFVVDPQAVDPQADTNDSRTGQYVYGSDLVAAALNFDPPSSSDGDSNRRRRFLLDMLRDGGGGSDDSGIGGEDSGADSSGGGGRKFHSVRETARMRARSCQRENRREEEEEAIVALESLRVEAEEEGKDRKGAGKGSGGKKSFWSFLRGKKKGSGEN